MSIVQRPLWICPTFVPMSNFKKTCVRCGKREDLHGQEHRVASTVAPAPR